MELLEILWQLLTFPFIFVDDLKMTGFEAFFWIVVWYFAYLFVIAFGIALFQGKHGHPYYDHRDGF